MIQLTKLTKIFIAGHKGLAGSAVWRELAAREYTNLLGKTSKQLDLRNQGKVNNFIAIEKPTAVIDAAARVGVFWPIGKTNTSFCSKISNFKKNSI